jgi:hypothetical protein
MIIAARYPTGTPPELQIAFKRFIGAAETIYFQDQDKDASPAT